MSEFEREISFPDGGMVASGPSGGGMVASMKGNEQTQVVDRPGGPTYDEIVRKIDAPILPPPKPPSLDATACHIADIMEIYVHDGRSHKAEMEIRFDELIGYFRMLTFLVGASLLVQGVMLFFAAFH